MTKLFVETEINGISLSNRFVRSATWEGMANDDGSCTSRLVDLMVNLGNGGVALIITSHTYVRRDGKRQPWQLGIYKDELVPGFRKMVREVHSTGAKIISQITHAGFYARSSLTGRIPLAPSNINEFENSPRREMSIQDIRDVVEAFGQAARRAKDAEFDGVQIHAAHGYLFSQFLSPLFNRRNDKYGGKIDNRCRALIEVVEKVKNVAGRDYPILVKINCQDFAENGLSLQDSVFCGKLLAEAGIEAIEVSGGLLISGGSGFIRTGINSEDKEAYFWKEAKVFKENLNIPIMLVGGIRSYNVAKSLIEEGVCDFISMSRPFIREPHLINHWKRGTDSKAACISCNKCFPAINRGEGIHCVCDE